MTDGAEGLSKARLRRLARLGDRKVRDDEGLLLIEGTRLVAEALRAGRVTEIFARDEGVAASWSDRAPGVPVTVVGATDLQRIADVRTPQEVLAVGPLHSYRSIDEILGASGRVLYLEAVQDPGNAGSLVRTAFGLGVGGVIFGAGSADPEAPKVLRASAGALFHVPLARGGGLDEVVAAARGSGHLAVVPQVSGGQDLCDLAPPGRFVLVASNEGRGSTGLFERGAISVTIPMSRGCESLNVAAACAVILGRWLLANPGEK